MIKNFEGFLWKMMGGYPAPAHIIIFLHSSILVLCLVPEEKNRTILSISFLEVLNLCRELMVAKSWWVYYTCLVLRKMKERKELYLNQWRTKTFRRDSTEGKGWWVLLHGSYMSFFSHKSVFSVWFKGKKEQK